ncbi:MAG: CinA family protein [Alphaproteobacteria bacterium]
MIDQNLQDLAGALLDQVKAAGKMVATAESCTGGLIAGTLTEVAGSSAVVERGFVTYSNEAKNELLGVPEPMLAEHGAVSEPVARAMAEGALQRSRADLAVAVTGVAGPGGGSDDKPVGLVHLAVAATGQPTAHRKMLYGDIGRTGIRRATVVTALEMLRAALPG